MIEIDLPVYIRSNGQLFISPERIELLRKIQSTGSLNAASKELNISYQQAWSLVSNMNNVSSNLVVMKHKGGTGGGGTCLSDFGEKLLKEYGWIEHLVKQYKLKLNIEVNL